MADEEKPPKGNAWGDGISLERQAELQAILQEWEDEADHGKRRGPFDPTGLHYMDFRHSNLTGADVYWLAARALSGDLLGDLSWETTDVATDRLLDDAAGAGDLAGGAGTESGLENLHLEGAILGETDLRGALLWGAHLEHANLDHAYLEGAVLTDALLQSASLVGTRLRGAVLRSAHLEGAILEGAYLEAASLDGAHLEQADLRGARLGGADLSGAYLDDSTVLTDISLADEHHGGALLADVRWRDANLAVVTWSQPHALLLRCGIQQLQAIKLGEESVARAPHDRKGKPKGWHTRQREAMDAVRANRQVATALRAQGLNEDADCFAYRAQLLQRKVLRRQGHRGRMLGSGFLDLISGYGYKPMRSFITYAFVILAFAAAYFILGGSSGHPLSWNEAIVVSMTAFHGRGFFSAIFQPSDPQAAVAAAEAFIGLLIEIVLIATFTQRFFAR